MDLGRGLPLVSVIVPMYQAESTIERALVSVKNQTYRNWECIVIDDGSTDDGARLAENLFGGDSRFMLVGQENAGRSSARNAGMEHASGDYVSFLDADDVLMVTFLERSVAAALDTGCDCVVTPFVRSDDGATSHNASRRESVSPSDAARMACAFWENRYLAPLPSYAAGTAFRSVCGKLMSSRHELPTFQKGLRFGEDLLFMLDFYERANNVVALEAPGYLYVKNPDSTTGTCRPGDAEAVRRFISCLQDSAGGGTSMSNAIALQPLGRSSRSSAPSRPAVVLPRKGSSRPSLKAKSLPGRAPRSEVTAWRATEAGRLSAPRRSFSSGMACVALQLNSSALQGGMADDYWASRRLGRDVPAVRR